jgi:hypothetical protein
LDRTLYGGGSASFLAFYGKANTSCSEITTETGRTLG